MTKREIAEEIKELTAQINALKQDNQEIPEAVQTRLGDLIQDFESFESVDNKPKRKEVKTMNQKQIINSAFHAALNGKEISEEAKALGFKMAIGTPGQVEGVDARGGVLVPDEVLAMKELRAGYVRLAPYFNRVTVSKPSGYMPVDKYNGSATWSTNTPTAAPAQCMAAFDELDSIDQKMLAFSKVEYTCHDYGCVIDLSKQVVADADADLMAIVGKSMVRRADLLDNYQILTKLAAIDSNNITVDMTANGAHDVDIADAIKTALNVNLAPGYAAKAIIITNQDGFNRLDKIKDSNKNYIMQPVIGDETRYQIKGHEVVVVDNWMLASTAAAAGVKASFPIYVVDGEDFATIFERQGLEIATSEEAGFGSYAVKVRGVVRRAYSVVDEMAGCAIKVETAAAL